MYSTVQLCTAGPSRDQVERNSVFKWTDRQTQGQVQVLSCAFAAKNDHTDDFLSPAQILSMIADGPSWHLGCAEPCAACVRWLVLRSGQAITLRNTATTRITTLSLGAINQAKHCIVHSNKIMRQYRFAIFYLDKNLPKHVHLNLNLNI